jgi:hypothetical protein
MTTGRTWPPTPLEDQQLAGAIMWGVGDAGFLVAILLVIAAWMRDEEARTRRREAVEDALAARGVREAPSEPGGAPASARAAGVASASAPVASPGSSLDATLPVADLAGPAEAGAGQVEGIGAAR